LVERAKKLGIKLGGGLVLREEPGYESGVAREAGFLEELEKLAPEAKLLKTQTGNGFGPEDGYKVASELVPQYKGQFNWMYGTNDAIALGGMQFVKSQGIDTEEILAVGGTCLGEATNKAVVSGLLAGSAVQSPAIEGGLAVRVLGQYLANGEEVIPGETTVSAEEPPSFSEPPHKVNNMPNPIIPAGSEKGFEETEIWGRPASELCTYG
jgi:ABC-type sugar transport system substrate-binding protein